MSRFLLALFWLFVMRAVLILHSGVPAAIGWAVLGDAVGALVLALLLERVTTRTRQWCLIAILGSAFYATGQHLATHGTLFRLAHLGYLSDPVFVSSSIFTTRALLLPLYLGLAWVLCRLHALLPRREPLRAWIALPALVVILAMYAVAAPTLTQPSANVVASLLAQIPGALLSRRAPPDAERVVPAVVAEDAPFFHRQLRGVATAERPNVLMIMIEGLSAAYFPKVAAYHDLEPAVELPELESRLAEYGFRTYLNVLSLQRQTNRGSYTLLCGAYPRIVTAIPKMTDVAEGRAQPLCLPERLRMAGYRTAYLQAAPMEFMGKDRFMPAIGFERAQGAEHFLALADIVGWGAPDEVFFPTALEWLRDLDRGQSPWFAALLTVGTHHPFPAEDPPAEPSPAVSADTGAATPLFPPERQAQRQAAFATMERSLLAFLAQLHDVGMLDRTLVVLTSDESGGFLHRLQETGPLDGNFGVLAIRPPASVELDAFAPPWALVSTLDVPLTVVDLLGLEPPAGFVGRSLLVTGPAPERGILAGDTYGDAVYFVLESGKLLACNEALIVCRSWRFVPDRMFGSLEPSADPAFLELPARRRLVQRAAAIDVPGVSDPVGTSPRR